MRLGIDEAVLMGLLLSLAAPLSANAAVVWRGDLATGDLSQWSGTEVAASNRLQVVTSPLRSGAHSMRVQVDSGDLVNGGCRAEAFAHTETEGSERYYAWSTLFPSDYPVSSLWQVFTQWHHGGSTGSPPLSFDAESEQIKLIANGVTTLWSTPLLRGVWRDFVFHVKFSANASLGFVEVWLDGVQVLAKTSLATLYPGQTVYLKQGYYRSPSISGNQVLYHSGMIEGENLLDVLPPPAPVPDFTLTAVDQSQSISQGQTASFRVSEASVNGFSGAVNLSTSGLPSGVTATIEQGTGGNSLVIVTTSASAATGTSNLNITGTSGSLTHTTSASLTIAAAAPPPSTGDFSLSLATPSEAAQQGGSASFAVTVDRVSGFAAQVTLSTSGLPSGLTAAGASSSGAGASLTVTVASSVAAGSYPFTITGTSDSLQRTAVATLVVTGAVAGSGGSGSGTGSSATKPASAFPAGGCSSAGISSTWALGLIALLWRRKRAAAG